MTSPSYLEMLQACFSIYHFRMDKEQHILASSLPTAISEFFKQYLPAPDKLNQGQPDLVQDQFSLWWLTFCRNHEQLVFGPIVTSSTDKSTAIEKLQSHFSDRDFHQVQQLIINLQINTITSLFQLSKIVYYMATGQVGGSPVFNPFMPKDQPAAVSYADMPKSHLGAYQVELTIKHYLSQGKLPPRVEAVGFKSAQVSDIRTAQISILQFIFICTHGAIDGGVSPMMAYNLANSFIEQTVNTYSIVALSDLGGKMLNAFVELVRNNQHNHHPLTPPIQLVKNYIDNHLDQSINLQHLADLINYSPSYLSRAFKNQMHLSITAYVMQEKIRRAKYMLVTSSKSINQIADELGFSSRHYFSRIFKQAVTQSPLQYRQSHTQL